MMPRGPAPSVVILLSTFNGAGFLRAQLDSFMAQDHAGWRLLWRDDGSCDGTVAMMQGFAAGLEPGRVKRLEAPGGRLGAAASFMCLLKAAAARLDEHELLAFADQDDVWLPLKLARADAALAGCDPDVPAIYSARQVLVDAGLKRLALSTAFTPPPGFPASLTQNLATGCTVTMNRAAAALVAGSEAPSGCQHDWWCYMLITAAGGCFLIDDEPVVLYRQHGGNLVGAPCSQGRRAIAAIRRGPGAFMALLRQNVAALDAQRHLLSPHARGQIDQIKLALRGGKLRRLRALRLPDLRRQTWAEQMLFRLWFMIG